MSEEMIIDGLDEIEVENTSVDEIDSENINLIFVGIDCSGSMGRFESDMRKALADFKDALINSKEADEILIARADFADRISVGGYKKISEFATNYDASGMTALNDTIVEGVDKLDQYRNFLKQEGMRVKAVFAIFSDGEDTSSRHSVAEARQKIEHLNNEEIVTAFISFGGGATQSAKDLKFKNILDVLTILQWFSSPEGYPTFSSQIIQLVFS